MGGGLRGAAPARSGHSVWKGLEFRSLPQRRRGQGARGGGTRRPRGPGWGGAAHEPLGAVTNNSRAAGRRRPYRSPRARHTTDGRSPGDPDGGHTHLHHAAVPRVIQGVGQDEGLRPQHPVQEIDHGCRATEHSRRAQRRAQGV